MIAVVVGFVTGLVAFASGFVIGAILGIARGSAEAILAAARERLAQKKRSSFEEAIDKVVERVRGGAMPTRQEVRQAAESNAVDAKAARFLLCHDPGCAGRGKHRCHNLDCRPHASAQREKA